MKKFRIITVLVAISFLVVTNVNAQFTSKATQVIEFVVPSGPYAGEVFFILQPGEDIGDLLAQVGVLAFMNKQELISSIPSKSGLATAKLIVSTSGLLSSLMKGSFSVQTQLTLVLEDGTSYVVFSSNSGMRLPTVDTEIVKTTEEKVNEPSKDSENGLETKS